MDRLNKSKAISVTKADPMADIALINQYSVKELRPEDVFCFSVVLCDNDVDRDLERFADKTLDELAPLFLGKTGIFDHRWTAEGQTSRLYRVEVETTNQKTALGTPLKRLVGSAYMLNTETNKAVIDAINGGILKEVSVGVHVKDCNCSLCGMPLSLDWKTWTVQCETGHIKGNEYPEGLCVGSLENAKDAYEFSFVAVPAQRNAGVTKGMRDLMDAFDQVLDGDLSKIPMEKRKALINHLIASGKSDAEREERAKILAENKRYLKKGKE